MWSQNYAPLGGSLGFSSLAAAVPIFVLLYLLGVKRKPSWVAALSGLSEELFFRGVLLREVGVIATSAIFGLLHALNRVYAVWAACIGAGFAALTIATGSLVAPIVAHATYNLGALLILRRDHAARAGLT